MKKSAAILIGADAIAQSNRTLAYDICKSNRELAETFESISAAEIRSKDRVDISLEEYEKMKGTIKSLSYEVDRLSSILKRIEVPLDKPIVPNSIETFWCEDAVHRRHIFNVRFAVDDYDLMK